MSDQKLILAEDFSDLFNAANQDIYWDSIDYGEEDQNIVCLFEALEKMSETIELVTDGIWNHRQKRVLKEEK